MPEKKATIEHHIDPFPRNTSKRITIIGAGIIGTSIARQLLLDNPDLEVILLEKEPALGYHQSGRNSGVLHSGINQKPGSLKARFAIEGNRLIREYSKKHGVKFEQCGTIVIARNKKEEKDIKTLYEWGNKAGVPGLQLLNRKELLDYEPYAQGFMALRSPTGSIIDSEGLLKQVGKEAVSLGAKLIFSTTVSRVQHGKVETNRGKFDPGFVINSAGLYADKIAHTMEVGKRYTIIPFRGDYYEVEGITVNSMIYQPPDLNFPFLGVHLTKGIYGGVHAGPTATLSFGREEYNKGVNIKESVEMVFTPNFWRMIMSKEFINLLKNNARTSFIPEVFLEQIKSITTQEISLDDLKPFRSGIRAQVVDFNGKLVKEFLIKIEQNRINIINAVSPGFTSSFAFAKHISRIVNSRIK